jgi:hypothetical protein
MYKKLASKSTYNLPTEQVESLHLFGKVQPKVLLHSVLKYNFDVEESNQGSLWIQMKRSLGNIYLHE